jgi:hypothetical protein
MNAIDVLEMAAALIITAILVVCMCSLVFVF